MEFRLLCGLRGRANRAAGFSLLTIALITGLPGLAEERESPYCRKVRAQAEQDAALLQWPTIQAEGIHFPSSSGEVGPTFGNNFQFRFGLSYSLSSAIQAISIKQKAEYECELHEASESLHILINQAADDAVLMALRLQYDYLEAHRDEWRQLMTQTTEKAVGGHITAIELQDLRRNVVVLERKLEDLTGEIERLEARTPTPLGASFETLSDVVKNNSLFLETESAHTAFWDAFRIKLFGGVVPDFSGRDIGWFGLVEFSYNLGGILSNRESARYRMARADEIREARYELPFQAAERRRDLKARAEKARRELKIVEGNLSSIKSLRAALDRSRGASADQVRAALLIEEFMVASDRIYLTALIEAFLLLAEESPPTN